MQSPLYPTHSQNGYGNSTVSPLGFTTTTGANYKSILSGSSKYVATTKIDVITSNKVVNKSAKKSGGKRWQFYRLNKSKVRKKSLAFASLRESRNFLAFYSISFPAGFPDRYCYQVHNTVLTRIRRLKKTFNYLWIVERQKNGTAHFHMLTNSFLNIGVVNHFYRAAIDNVLSDNPDLPIHWDRKAYNGCDVKRVTNVKGVSCYMTKYMTKNTETWERLPWNCSSVISRLFTSAHVSQDYIDLCKDVVAVKCDEVSCRVLQSQFGNVRHIYFKGAYKSGIIRLMDAVNQNIVDNNMQNVNTLLFNFHKLQKGYSFDRSGKLRKPVFANENVTCNIKEGYNQFVLNLDASVWFN